MNENLFMFSQCLKFHQIARVYARANTRKKDILPLGFWGIACCKLTLTLARQI